MKYWMKLFSWTNIPSKFHEIFFMKKHSVKVLWNFMKFHEKFHEIFHEILWNFIKFNQLEFHEISWNISWNFMKYFMKFHEIRFRQGSQKLWVSDGGLWAVFVLGHWLSDTDSRTLTVGHRNDSTFTPKATFRGWCDPITLNMFTDHWRRKPGGSYRCKVWPHIPVIANWIGAVCVSATNACQTVYCLAKLLGTLKRMLGSLL
jgi:hypothetical protein